MADGDAQTLVRSIYAAFARDDTEAALSLYAEDVAIRQAPGTPWAGTFAGHAGFRVFAARLFSAVSRLEILDISIVGNEERAVVLETLRLSRSGAEPIDVEAIEVFVVQSGLVRRVDVWYRDPRAVAEWLTASVDDGAGTT